MAQEVELKLRLPPQALPALRRLALPGVRGRAVSERLHSVYYDTPEFALKRAGMALRLRRAGRRWVQTLKGGGGAVGGVHTRDEWECPVPGAALDRERLPADALPAAPEVWQALRPVFVTEFSRRRRLLAFEGGERIEFAVDRGEVRTDGAAQPICEIELELKAGAPWRLYEVALALVRALPARIEDRSKAERGYALAQGVTPAPVKAGPVAMTPEMPAHEAFRAVLRACLAHLQANEEGMLEGRDPEYLHQMRVAMRRMRSGFGLFRDLAPREAVEPAVAELRWLTSCLGPARDWDVFVTETLARIGAAPGIESFRQAAQERHAQALAGAREAVASPRFQELLLGLGAWITLEPWLAALPEEALAPARGPVAGFAAGVLEDRYRQVLKRGRNFAKLAPVERHRLRIGMKKLRYAGEFFSALYPGKTTRAFLKAASELQDELGALNDAAVTTRLTEEARQHHGSHTVIGAAGYIEGWIAADAAHRAVHSREAWKKFLEREPFWK